MSRDGIVFYESFYQAVKELEPEAFKECVTALMEYGLYGNEIEMSGVARMFFTMAKPQVDVNNKRYENGKKGGAKRKQIENKPVANATQSVTKAEPKQNQVATKMEPIIVDELIDKERKRSMYAPDIEDVKSFIALKGLDVNAEEFWHHYDSVNWEMNGTHPDWRKLVMAWGARAKNRQYNKKPSNTVTGSVFADLFVGGNNGN